MPPVTALAQVYRKIDELVEEYKTDLKARRNVCMELRDYKEKNEGNEKQLRNTKEDLRRQNENAEHELETRAKREDETHCQAQQNQTKQLDEQRIYYAEKLQEANDTNKEMEDKQRTEREARVKAEEELITTTAAYREDLL